MTKVTSERLHALGAAALANRLRRGALSATDVIEAFIDQIERVDDVLNAVAVRRFDEARAEAAAADAAQTRGELLGPLHGVPITVTEQFAVADTTTHGLTRRGDYRASASSPLVGALRDAGAIVLGSAKVPHDRSIGDTEKCLCGVTRNPWDLARTPGEGGGGAAAIIAAGGSPLGLGSDLSGGIRLPAHATGIAGLKPTDGRLTMADALDDIANPSYLRSQAGPLGRDVADLHLAMSVLAPASAAATDASSVAPAYPAELPALGGLRFAVLHDDAFFRCAPAVRRALREACADLTAAGAQMISFDPPPLAEAARLSVGVLTADGGAWLRSYLHGDDPGRHRAAGLLKAAAVPSVLRPLIGAALRHVGQRNMSFEVSAARPSGPDFVRLAADIRSFRAAYTDALDHSRVDFVISPAHALPAVRHGASDFLHFGNAAAYASLYSLLGLPAGVVPVTRVAHGEESDRPRTRDRVEQIARESERGSAGLPIGVQVAARLWREDVVLAAMSAVEKAVRDRLGVPFVGDRAIHDRRGAGPMRGWFATTSASSGP